MQEILNMFKKIQAILDINMNNEVKNINTTNNDNNGIKRSTSQQFNIQNPIGVRLH